MTVCTLSYHIKSRHLEHDAANEELVLDLADLHGNFRERATGLVRAAEHRIDFAPGLRALLAPRYKCDLNHGAINISVRYRRQQRE